MADDAPGDASDVAPDAAAVADGVVVAQTMQRADEDGSGVRIETLTLARIPENFAIMQEFLGSKHCCCLVPMNCCCESEADAARTFSKWPKDKRALGAVALDTSTDRVIGIIQGAGFGHPCELHKPKKGEVYVDHLAVTSEARGKGVGTKLLNWLEAAARARGDHTLVLSVLRGNPARRLYLRFGFVSKKADPCEEACGAIFVATMFGRPYGCCNPGWGAEDMYKSLA